MASKVKTISLSLVTKDTTNSVKSYQLSKRYVQRLLKIGAINILYRRIDIPEQEFLHKNYENADYMVIQRKSTNKFIRNYHVFMNAIIDAVEKDYLKEIFMYILDKLTNQILESYNFKIKYNKDTDVIKSSVEAKIVRDTVVEFLQALSVIPGEKWSSDKVELFMEFSYNDGTPQEYEPPYFQPANTPLCTGLHPKKIVRLCSINTGFHKLSAWGTGKNFALSRASTPAPSVCIPDVSVDLDDVQDSKEQSGRKRKHEEDADHKKKSKISRDEAVDSPFINVTDEIDMDNITIASSEEYVSCLCGWELAQEFETTRCKKCYLIVHLACHGYINLNDVDQDTFLCYLCSDIKANKKQMTKLIKLRVVLYGIHMRKELPNEIEMTTPDEKKYILHQLDKLGIYKLTAESKSDINMNMLNKALLTAFAKENSQYLE